MLASKKKIFSFSCLLALLFAYNFRLHASEKLTKGAISPPSLFRLHLFSEPQSFSLLHQKNSNSFYFFNQLTCPLLKWDNQKLIPNIAKCELNRTHTKASCKIDEKAKFQDGTPILAEHFALTIQNFLTSSNPAPRADIFFSIKNAKNIFLKLKNIETLGVKAKGRELVFELETPDSDFLQDLTQPFYTASLSIENSFLSNNPEKSLSCGPYFFSERKKGLSVRLKPNPYYMNAHKDRPELEFLFISEDSLAYQYYLKNELHFLRRLPTLHLSKWLKSPELMTAEQVRLDYLGFNAILNKTSIPAILAQSIDFNEWQKLYHAKPRPGCFGLPETWSKGQVCWDFSEAESKQKLTEKIKQQIKNIKLSYSKLGGDDHERTMDFLQDQWRKNISIAVQTEGLENKVYLQKLEKGDLVFFRKGIAPTRATCLAAVEKFEKNHPENYIRFNDNEFHDYLIQLKSLTDTDIEKKSDLCRKLLLLLKNQAHIIPTGPLYFSMLLKPEWEGVFLNQLNQLDLTQLHFKKSD